MKRNVTKLLVSVTTIAAMCAALTACGSSTTPATETTSAGEASTTEGESAGTATTLKDGVLMVGVEIGYPPMEYFDEDGTTPIGFDIEVSKAIGEKMGLSVEYVDTAWDGIFAGVDADKYDCIISAVSITEERQQNHIMTEAYVANKLVLVTPNDSTLTSPEELGGHSVAVQAETTADDYMRDLNDGGLDAELFEYDKVLNCFDDLKAGRVDAVLVDSVVASYYLGDEASDYKTAWENTEGEPLGICLKKGNDALAAEIEAAVDALYEDGTMATIATKYFGSDITEGLR